MPAFKCDSPPNVSFPCDICGETFEDIGAKRAHHLDQHSHRYTLARERPLNRGDVPCGVAGCPQTFASAGAAHQHRKMKHGI